MAQPPLVVPVATGAAALAEIERVPWHDLMHAYGRGTVGPGLHQDVTRALRMLGDAAGESFDDAVNTLHSNICHQGTIYEATSYAVPFLAAFVADEALREHRADSVGLLLGCIAVASSFETEDGGRAGSFGEDVAERTRLAFRESSAHLTASAASHPQLAPLFRAIATLAAAEDVREEHRRAVAKLVDALGDAEEEEDEEDEPGAPPLAERVAHAKFGSGLLVRREGETVCVRFDDGIERLLLEKFVTRV